VKDKHKKNIFLILPTYVQFCNDFKSQYLEEIHDLEVICNLEVTEDKGKRENHVIM